MRLLTGIQPLVALYLLLPAQLPADPAQYIGQKIVSLRFEPEQQPLLPEELTRNLRPLELGRTLQLTDVRTAIAQLFESGRYANIVVEASAQDGGVALVFRTEGSQFVRGVVVEGVPEPPNKGQLVNATKLQLGTSFYDAQIRQATESLLEVLRSNGFYLAKVDAEKIVVPEAQQVDLRFRVSPGNRAKFDRPVLRGNLQWPESRIVDAAGWKRFFGFLGWKSVTENRVTQGIDRIRNFYQKRDHLMARVGLDQIEYRSQENRVVPQITIDAGPKVIVQTKGADISRGRLRQLVPVFQEQTVDRDLLVEGQRNLTDYFQTRGYFDAEADFDITTNARNEQVVEFAIYPGERHKLVRLEIDGNEYFDDATLRERMYIMPATLLRFRHGRYSLQYLRRDVEAIKDLYRSNGFRDVEVNYLAEDDYQGKQNEVAVQIDIIEGPQWFVSSLTLQGVSEENMPQVQALLQSSEGQPYSDLNVATDQSNILSYYFNNGYPDARFDASVKPSDRPNQMDLTFTIQEGERQFVRSVLVSGLKISDPELIYSRINLRPGDPLSQSSMTESQRRLYDLGVFARVDAALQNSDGEEQNKYVLYRVEEARRYSVSAGFGAQLGRIGKSAVNSFESPAGTAGFSPRVSLGVSRSNFLGVAHTISLQTRISNVQRRGVLTYLAPQFKGYEDVSLTFTGLYDDSRDIQTFSARRYEGSAQLQQRLTKANTIQYRLAYRRVTTQLAQGFLPQLVPLLAQAVQLGVVSTTFIQDRRDDPSDAKRGVYNTVDFGFASNLFGSKTSFTRTLVRTASYHRLTRDVVLARALTVGNLDRISRADVPLPERFFAGGATLHRGFAENQAGPRDSDPAPDSASTGFPVGGKAILVNTVELRFPLLGDNIAGVLFHDAGNVYTTLGDVSFRTRQRDLTDFNYMVHAAGFGVRYRTPIGPMRVDLAYSINPPAFVGLRGPIQDILKPDALRERQRLSRFQFHFSLGQAF